MQLVALACRMHINSYIKIYNILVPGICLTFYSSTASIALGPDSGYGRFTRSTYDQTCDVTPHKMAVSSIFYLDWLHFLLNKYKWIKCKKLLKGQAVVLMYTFCPTGVTFRCKVNEQSIVYLLSQFHQIAIRGFDISEHA